MMQKQKFQLREMVARRIEAMGEKERSAESRSVCRRVMEKLQSSSRAEHGDQTAICAYYPIRNEVDILPLLQELPDAGRKLYLPRMENGKAVFRCVEDLSQVHPGAFGIPEPSHNSPELPHDAQIIAFVPGRAFTSSGARLGRGNGGYDHWIDRVRKYSPESQFWGVCFECQIVPEMPLEPHDQPVDAVLTARGKVGELS